MAYGVWHVHLGVELNATLPDLGCPKLPNLWQALIDARPIRAGVLECLAPHDCPRWMLPVEATSSRARHFRHYTRVELQELAAKSDLHIATQEYVASRAEREGLSVQIEMRRPNVNRVVDVRIGGDAPLACEVQVSHIAEATVLRRAAIDYAAGDIPLWIANDPKSPAINRAPWSRIAKTTPQRIAAGTDDLLLGGVMNVEWERCGRRDPLCPLSKRKPCGELHPYFEPARAVHLDQLVIGAATGQFKTTRRKEGRALRHIWLSIRDYESFQEIILPHAETTVPVTPLVIEPRELDYECRYGEETGIRSSPTMSRDTGKAIFAGQPIGTCCGQRHPGRLGEPHVLACKLCPNSPTYWQRT